VFEAKTRGVPIVLLDVIGGGFDVGRMQAYISDLETKMGATNPTGLELLKQELQATPLSQLQEAVLDVLESFDAGAVLSWNPGAGDRAMLAALKDLVERMALLTKRKVHWRGEKNKTRNSARWNSKVLSVHDQNRQGDKVVSSDRMTVPGSISDDLPRTAEASVKDIAAFVISETAFYASASVLAAEIARRLDRCVSLQGGGDARDTVLRSSCVVVLLTKNRDVRRAASGPSARHNSFARGRLQLRGRSIEATGRGECLGRRPGRCVVSCHAANDAR